MLDLLLLATTTPVTPWFTNAGAVAGILGAGVGVFGGGIYGPLVGVLAPKGKAKGLVLGYHFLLLVAGIVLVAIGMVALMGGQPYGVWYGFLLSGGLLAMLMTLFTPMVFQRYREAEQRRLQAEEFRRGGGEAAAPE